MHRIFSSRLPDGVVLTADSGAAAVPVDVADAARVDAATSQPEVAAEAIIWASRPRRRELWVGGSTVAAATSMTTAATAVLLGGRARR